MSRMVERGWTPWKMVTDVTWPQVMHQEFNRQSFIERHSLSPGMIEWLESGKLIIFPDSVVTALHADTELSEQFFYNLSHRWLDLLPSLPEAAAGALTA